MAVVDAPAGLLFTAAPGTGSTALIVALHAQRDGVAVPPPDAVRVAGIDAKHVTAAQLVATGLLDASHGLHVVKTTRNPRHLCWCQATHRAPRPR